MFNPVRVAKEKTVGGVVIKISEMTIRDIKRLWTELSTMESIDAFLQKNWASFIDGISLDDCDLLTPGELGEIYEAFREANQTFFALAAKAAAADPSVQAMLAAITNDLIAHFAALPKEDIPGSGITDTDSSPQP